MATFFSAAEGKFEARTLTLEAVDAEGKTHHLLRTEMPVVQDGMLVRAWGITRDITDLRVAEEALRESEERNRNLIENAPVGIYQRTLDGRILMGNPALVRMLGCSSLEELARANPDLGGFAPAYSDHQIKKLLENPGEARGIESEWRRPDGSALLVRENVRAVRNEAGQFLYFEGTAEDITERKRVEALLRQSEERLRLITDSVKEIFFLVDLSQRKVLYVSPAYEEIWGRSCQSLCEHAASWLEQVHPDDLKRLEPALRAVWKTGRVEGELRVVRPDGSVRWIWARIAPVPVEEGKPRLAVGIADDITERKRVETALLESEARHRSLFENATVGIYRTTPEGQIVLANPALVKMLGYNTLEELTHRNLEENGFEPNYPRQHFREKMEKDSGVDGLGRRPGIERTGP